MIDRGNKLCCAGQDKIFIQFVNNNMFITTENPVFCSIVSSNCSYQSVIRPILIQQACRSQESHAPSVFDRSGIPISTKGADYVPYITTPPPHYYLSPGFLYLPKALHNPGVSCDNQYVTVQGF